jgi:Holliday junction DNA helicase RuvB subunit
MSTEGPARDTNISTDDQQFELSVRPTRLAEYIGQRQVKENLRVYMKAALNRKEALDHVLLTGPPGLGKTTLANIIAHEMGAMLHSTAGPSIEIPGDLVGQLTNLQKGDVLFIDEIHRLNPAIEEKLYPAMEDYEFDLMIGQGVVARTQKIRLEKFTLIGATTRPGLLPLRCAIVLASRFIWTFIRTRIWKLSASVQLKSLRLKSTKKAPVKSPNARAAPRALLIVCCAGFATTRRSITTGVLRRKLRRTR